MSLRTIFKLKFIFRQSLQSSVKRSFLCFLVSVLCFKISDRWNSESFEYVEPSSSYYNFHHSQEIKDWHDYAAIQSEHSQKGPGENGEPVYISKDEEELSQKIIAEHKHNGLVSDKIARNRSIPDSRPQSCQNHQYLRELPSVSIVVPFYNEILSTLTRTIHSLFNRTPPEILKEIIIVNDHSDKEYLYKDLEDYITANFDTTKLKMIVLPDRQGLILARLAGAKAAKGDVLVFLDCHVEVNTNWLPPLIQPIAKDYRIVTCPYIDTINPDTYKYIPLTTGVRGVFSWRKFYYQHLPLRPGDQNSVDQPFKSPVMVGCAFAISAKFFWELGGYDTGLDIWGGEQFELSFKVWLCGGTQIDVPCSHVGHLFRERPFVAAENRMENYWDRNFKRVAEVWMDDFKQHIYDRSPEHWAEIETGDLTEMMNLKEKLNCKPFKFFMEEVAPDMLDRFPIYEPPAFASGGIRSVANPNLCVDTSLSRSRQIKLSPCLGKLEAPGFHQVFRLRKHRDIFINNTDSGCLEKEKGRIWFRKCTFLQLPNQYFRYDLNTKQIFGGPRRDNICIDTITNSNHLFMSFCDETKLTQKWDWGFVNETMLMDWSNYGKPIVDKIEKKLFEKL